MIRLNAAESIRSSALKSKPLVFASHQAASCVGCGKVAGLTITATNERSKQVLGSRVEVKGQTMDKPTMLRPDYESMKIYSQR